MRTEIHTFNRDTIIYGHINITERVRKIFDQVIDIIEKSLIKDIFLFLRERKEMAIRCFFSHLI